MPLKELIARLWLKNKTGLLAFALAAAVTLFFGVRFLVFVVYWGDQAHRDQAIEGWMTPGYIARSYHVPKPIVIDALGIGDEQGRRRSLAAIAQQKGVPLPDLSQAILTAIEAERQRAK